MTFNDIWQKLCIKKPSLKNPDSKVEFISKNLQTLLRQVYEQGESQGAANASIQENDEGDFVDRLMSRFTKK